MLALRDAGFHFCSGSPLPASERSGAQSPRCALGSRASSTASRGPACILFSPCIFPRVISACRQLIPAWLEPWHWLSRCRIGTSVSRRMHLWQQKLQMFKGASFLGYLWVVWTKKRFTCPGSCFSGRPNTGVFPAGLLTVHLHRRYCRACNLPAEPATEHQINKSSNRPGDEKKKKATNLRLLGVRVAISAFKTGPV